MSRELSYTGWDVAGHISCGSSVETFLDPALGIVLNFIKARKPPRPYGECDYKTMT